MRASERYGIETESDATFGVEAFVLCDRLTGSRARVLPSLGNNLTGFTAGLSGRRLEVMLTPCAGERAPRPTRYGNPILFPFPNRVRGATYTFEGRRHRLEVNTPEGHHIHGLVRNRPWRVEEAAPRGHGAVLRCSFVAEEHADVLRQYPFPFALTITYTLAGNRLRLDAEVRNVGNVALPMGFGLHPYFRLPLVDDSRPYDCRVYIPARQQWVLDHDKLPTGRQVLVPPDLDFRSFRPLGEAQLDHVYGGLLREKGKAVCRLRDPDARVELSVRFGPEFPVLVVFAPAERPTICFEPYSCVTDAINLSAKGQDGGLFVLQPDRVWRGGVEFAVADVE